MDAPEAMIRVKDVLVEAKQRLEPGAVGSLVAIVSDLLYSGNKKSTLRMIQEAGLDELLFDHEFIDGVGARLKSKHLIKLAFLTGTSFSDTVNKLGALITADAINICSSSALEALHGGLAYAGYGNLASKVALVTRLVSELDSFAEAGLFLSLFLDCPQSRLDGDDVVPLLRGVLRNSDVRDLAGEKADLLACLPLAIAEEVRGAFGGEDSSDDSDENDEGNLRDFVVSDDHLSEDEGSSSDEADDSPDSAGATAQAEALIRAEGTGEGGERERGASLKLGPANSASSFPGSRPVSKREEDTSLRLIHGGAGGTRGRAGEWEVRRVGAAVRAAQAQAGAPSSAFLSAFDELSGGDGLGECNDDFLQTEVDAGAAPAVSQVKGKRPSEATLRGIAKRSRYLDKEAGVGRREEE